MMDFSSSQTIVSHRLSILLAVDLCGNWWLLCSRLVFNYNKEDVLGRHDGPVRCVEYSYATGWFFITNIIFICL